jgi:hypothetical protein
VDGGYRRQHCSDDHTLNRSVAEAANPASVVSERVLELSRMLHILSCLR